MKVYEKIYQQCYSPKRECRDFVWQTGNNSLNINVESFEGNLEAAKIVFICIYAL